jgi:hypothetical protein
MYKSEPSTSTRKRYTFDRTGGDGSVVGSCSVAGYGSDSVRWLDMVVIVFGGWVW